MTEKTENLNRVPPHSDEAEVSVLGSAMFNQDALLDVLDILTSDDFYSEKHKEIFSAIRDLNRRLDPVDALTVSEELVKRKTLDMVGGRAYVASLLSEVPSPSNASKYARIVKDKAIVRRLIDISVRVIEEGFSNKVNAGELLNMAEREIQNITRGTEKKDYVPLSEIVWSNIEEIGRAADAGGGITGMTTGFMDLDSRTSGMQRSDLIIVAARPSMGKTAFALNMAQNAAFKGGAVTLIFSLEMPKERLSQRILSSWSMVELTKFKTGDLTDGDWDDLNIAVDQCARLGIYIDDTNNITVAEIRNKCRRLKSRKGLDLVVIDYLQLMESGTKNENRQQEVSTISRQLKQLAREMDCPVVVLSQLSRAVDSRPDKHPVLSDLRESGAIEQDADIVMFLYRDEYYNQDDTEKPNTCEVNIAKNRNGPTGSVELTWLGQYTKFTDRSNIKYDQ